MRAKTQQQQDESSKKKARKKNKSAAVSSTPQGTKGHVGRPTGQGKGTVEWFGSEFRMPGPVESSSGPDSGAIKAPLKSDRAAELERERACFMSSKAGRVNAVSERSIAILLLDVCQVSRVYGTETKEEQLRGRKFRKGR